ncbi:unnamed protein product [Auanema sp. JU1783]|nr:unnamed protein product [Auanema sp. JU1783]
MVKDLEIDAERKAYESDDIWLTRKAFLSTHWDSFPKLELDCLSQLFININMLGCEYSPTLMDRIRSLGSGITEMAQRLQDEDKYVKASQGRQKADEVRQKQQEERTNARTERRGPSIDDKLRELKIHIKQAIAETPLNLLNMAGRVQMPWSLDCVKGDTELRLKHFIAFRHKFHHTSNGDAIAISCVVDGFLNCEPSLAGDNITFDNFAPSDCYKQTLLRKLQKARHHVPVARNYKSLQETLAKVNLELTQNSEHLQGWSQRVDLRVDDLLLISRTLTKNECVKSKLTEAVDEMCKNVCDYLQRGNIEIEDTGSGLRLLI